MGQKKKRKFKLANLGYAFLVLFLSGFFICGGAGIYYISSILKDAPELDISKLNSQESSRIYDMDGELIVDLGEQSRENVSYEQIPQVVIDAFVACEDSRFFEHNGFDLPRFVKAAIVNLQTGSFAQGGSTFTMQTMKKAFFETAESLAEKSIPRKVKEIYLSIQAEKVLEKEEILEFYLNKINFGGNNYGIQKGAQYYFGKNVEQLTLSEAAYLAGVINAPGSYDAYNNLDLATKRRNVVLNLMAHHGYITEEEAAMARSIRLEDLLIGDINNQDEYPYQAYIDAVAEECEELTGKNPYEYPMVVYTYMDRDAQEHAEKVLAGETSVKFPKDDELFQAAFTMIENQTGHIVAIGGGRDYKGQRQFNRAMSMKKQPGSTAKPLLAYSLALDDLGWATSHVIEDMPIVYRGTQILLPNVDGQYLGEIDLHEALARSRNTSAMLTFEALADRFGTEYLLDHIRNYGFDIDPGQFTLGYVIGSSTFEVTPTQLASAYSVFANEGEHINPTTIKRIEFMDGSAAIEPQFFPVEVISEEAAFLISDLMYGNVYSEWYNYMQILKNNNYKVYAKTGTTDYGEEAEAYGIKKGTTKDKWCAGYTSEYSIAVWTGYDKPVKGKETYFTQAKNQLNIPVTIVKEMLFNQHKTEYPKDVAQPEGVTTITHVKGTYPYAESDQVDPSLLTTGFIKKEYAQTVPMGPEGVDTLTSFEAAFQEETNSLIGTFTPYPDLNRTLPSTGTKEYELTYWPTEGDEEPEIVYDEEGNPVGGTTITAQGKIIYDSKLYFGPVQYKMDVYANGELVASGAGPEPTLVIALPVLETNEIQVCGYYGLSIATDVKSNEICQNVIIPFSSQLPEWDGDYDFGDIWDNFSQTSFLNQIYVPPVIDKIEEEIKEGIDEVIDQIID